MQPPMNENEIVLRLAEEYEEIIQNASRVQHIDTVLEFDSKEIM